MLVPLVARGGVIGMIAFAAAESKRRYGDEDLAFARELASRAAFALENARLYEEAQRATRAREDLLATVSHDLKNPLSAIHLATTILKERAIQQEDTRACKHLDAVSRAAGRMERLIADLLDMASIQAGRLSVDKKAHDATHIVRDALEQHQTLAEERSILLLRHGETANARVLCDRDRILQVLSNLIGNALKFCRPGESVTLLCEARGKEVHFAVVDTGPGIAVDDLPRIFEPYWTARSQARRGTGLGLFISKGILEMHDGRIWVDSRVGLGTSFNFSLPRA
jgi:signal transduction histidine kinase